VTCQGIQGKKDCVFYRGFSLYNTLLLVYIIDMENAWTYGAREVLAELEREAREGMETEGEPCDRCGGSGLEKLDPRTFDPIPCPICDGSGREG
jgi:hypothetical protein